MYRWGAEGGRPPHGRIGSAPEWFYKGDGSILRAHREALTVPAFAEDGGEEPEVAGVYVIDQQVQITRQGSLVWRKEILSGQRNMAHSLENIEHHHFKYPLHRRPGDVHIHFFGADAFSFGEGISLKDGDVFEIGFAGLGRPLINPVRISTEPETLVIATPA
jgi:hypothetical protein